jgi:hypothetical protein
MERADKRRADGEQDDQPGGKEPRKEPIAAVTGIKFAGYGIFAAFSAGNSVVENRANFTQYLLRGG